MDPTTASYYRSILFRDSQDQRPLPPSLVLLHAWAFKRFQVMGAGSIISKQAALCVAMTWMSSTKEGWAFTREQTNLGDLFDWEADDHDGPLTTIREFQPSDTAVDWDEVPVESKVVVMVDHKPMQGEFIGRRGGWIDIRLDGELKPFRTSQVQLAAGQLVGA